VAEFKQFVEDMRREGKVLVDDDQVTLHKVIAIEALKGVVLKTPADTGTARGNWNLEINAISGAVNLEEKAKTGGATIAKGLTILSGLKPRQLVTISNNVPYIFVLEDGGFIPPDPGPSEDKRIGRRGEILVRGGFSVQAPHGMVQITATELGAFFT
jgi:hypothetical protein